MIAFRILVVLAAAAFVAAFAIATLFSPLTTLTELVVRDGVQFYQLHDAVVAHSSRWVWDNVALPLLQRPAWLPAVALGMLCAGGATTLASRPGMPRSHRRRS